MVEGEDNTKSLKIKIIRLEQKIVSVSQSVPTSLHVFEGV